MKKLCNLRLAIIKEFFKCSCLTPLLSLHWHPSFCGNIIWYVEQIKEKDYVAKETRNTQENGKISGNIRKASRLKLVFDHFKKIG